MKDSVLMPSFFHVDSVICLTLKLSTCLAIYSIENGQIMFRCLHFIRSSSVQMCNLFTVLLRFLPLKQQFRLHKKCIELVCLAEKLNYRTDD